MFYVIALYKSAFSYSLTYLFVAQNASYARLNVLTYRAVNGSAPKYLSSYFTRVANVPLPSRLRLRSYNSDQLMVPSYNLIIVGRRPFPVFAANLWNSLPANLTSAPSLTIFRQRLKTHLFQRSYPDLII